MVFASVIPSQVNINISPFTDHKTRGSQDAVQSIHGCYKKLEQDRRPFNCCYEPPWSTELDVSSRSAELGQLGNNMIVRHVMDQTPNTPTVNFVCLLRV